VKPHDCEGLNDMECWHVERFAELLDLWRHRNMSDTTCFRLARQGAMQNFPLEPDEAARVDEYILSRFGEAKIKPEPEEMPLPAPWVP
jgi:hypothetical protein